MVQEEDLIACSSEIILNEYLLEFRNPYLMWEMQEICIYLIAKNIFFLTALMIL